MPENEQEKNTETEKIEKNKDNSAENEKRSYYYDDACGYEIYTEDEENDEDS